MADDTDFRPDIAATRNKMRSRLGSNREIRKLPEHLMSNKSEDFPLDTTEKFETKEAELLARL